MEYYPVIIIGGGIAGLTCATYLQKQSVPFLLLEASASVGGRVQTDYIDGFQLDRGFQIFLTSYPEAKKILDYEALQLKAFRSGAIIRQQEEFIHLINPLKEPLAVFQDLFSSAGTLSDKIKILQLVTHLSSKTEEDIFTQIPVSTLDFLHAYGWSNKIIESFFRPFFGGVFLENNLTTSSNFFQFVFQQFAIADAVLPAKGIQAIPEQLAGKLPKESIRTSAPVQKIEGNTIYLTNGQSLQGEAIILAVDAASSQHLLGRPAEQTFNETTCLYFSANKSPLDTNLLVINGKGQGYINHLCVLSDIAPSYAPDGKVLISVNVVKRHTLTAEELPTVIGKELMDWFGEQVQTWQFLKSYHLPQALPEHNANATYLKEWRVRENVYRCGDYTAYPSLNGAMKTGRIVAQIVAEKIKNVSIQK